MIRLTLFCFVWGSLASAPAQDPSSADKLLVRRYEEGARSSYLMKGENDGSTYEVRLAAVVKKGDDGRFFEEYACSDLVRNGKPRSLSVSSLEFRQGVSLQGGGAPFSPPDISQTPELVGPVMDLITFYADLFLAMHAGELREAGDRFVMPSPQGGSWADGTRVLIGEDAVDFDIALTEVDKAKGVATLLVKHVPPEKPEIKIPAEWMRQPVADTANNFVQVVKAGEKYVASVGKETFDVEMKIRLADGKLLAATMENPVEKIARECLDVELTECGEPRRVPILRRISLLLVE